MDVSIIIVNYNSGDLLLKCLNSIFYFTKGINFEIVIVDNASDDNSLKLINEEYKGKIKILTLGENIGFGRANNEGTKISKGRNLFFLNPDTILLNNAVKELSDFLDNNPDIGAIGGNLFRSDMKPAHSFKRFFPSVFWELNELFCEIPERILFGKNAQFNHTNNILDVAYVTGADLMIPRWVFNQVGGFDPNFFMYFEESDLEKKIKDIRLRILSLPTAKIMHKEGGSFEKNEKRTEVYLKGRKQYFKSNSSIFLKHLCDFIFYFKIYSRIIFFGLFFNIPRKNYWIKIRDLFNIYH